MFKNQVLNDLEQKLQKLNCKVSKMHVFVVLFVFFDVELSYCGVESI